MDTPQLVESLKGKKVVDAACGSSHSACILDDGTLYTWGKGRYGRLGHNDHDPQYKPKQVSCPAQDIEKMNLKLVASSLHVGPFPAWYQFSYITAT